MVVTLAALIGAMSPSRIETAGRCLAQFGFRYVEKAQEKGRSSDLCFGSAIDELGNDVYREKAKTRATPTVRDVQERFAAAWDYHSDAVDVWHHGDSRGELLDIGTKAVALWRDRIVANVQPEKVQEKLAVEMQDPISGDTFTLRGIVDVVGTVQETRDVTVDLKKSRRRYKTEVFDRSSQPVAYTILTGSPIFEFHVLVTTKDPQTQVLHAVIPDSDRVAFARRTAMLRRQIAHAFKTGDWLPNRAHFLCSHRYCEFAATCERRYGGRVPA